jgi:hypothetical protein
VPGMTQPDELLYFYWCAAKHHRPGRRVVELGPWIGCSTMALAAGIRRSADPAGKVITIDNFSWDEWALNNVLDWTVGGLSDEQRARLGDAVVRPRLGSSFMPIFHEYTAPYKDSIHAIHADLAKYKWTGEPIDVLMVDAAKSWETFDQIVREFFPCLTDGAAVIHQDYKHFSCYWLQAVTERMIERGVLSVAENADGLPTHGFRFHRTAGFRPADYLESAFTPTETDRLLRRSASRFRGFYDRLPIVSAYHEFLCDYREDRAAARQVVRDALSAGGYADNYGLHDLLGHHEATVLPLAARWLEQLGSANAAARSGAPLSLQASGVHSVSLAVPNDRSPAHVDLPPVATAGWSKFVLQFRIADHAAGSVWVRVQAMDGAQGTPFHDEEVLLTQYAHQTVVIPATGHDNVRLRWTAWSEGAPSSELRVECVAPLAVA